MSASRSAGAGAGDPVAGPPAGPLRAFVAELAAHGVRDAVVCPGSRSTPLALALRSNPAVRVLVQLDERAAAYFALGLAKAARRPVALLATSGTAVVNFAPAVAEAKEGRVPLVVLTADRPPELRDRGANQTLDQVRLYGRHAKWFAELSPPDDATGASEAHVRWVAARAVATAVEAPAGPVQVNWPFREPLLPQGSLVPEAREHEPAYPAPAVVRMADKPIVEALADRLAGAERPLLVCGPLDRPDVAAALAELGRVGGVPVLADGLASVRTAGPGRDGATVLARHDALLRVDALRSACIPDLVVRLGATPTSKVLAGFLAGSGADQVVIDDGGWNEPLGRPAAIVRADPEPLLRAVVARLASTRDAASTGARPARRAWLDTWLAADRAADAAIGDALAGLDEPFEGAVLAALGAELPADTIAYVGSSMPVRDLDAFLPADVHVRTLANRGVSGIDGVVSSALGAAAAGVGPVLAVIGDLAFVHDLNALVAARLHRLDLALVVIDNDGGGIFSFLPQAAADRPDVGLPEHYEELFGTPHGTDVLAVAAALGAEVADLEPGRIGEQLREALRGSGVRVLRLRTERRRNVELHREITAAVTAAVERVLAPAGVPG